MASPRAITDPDIAKALAHPLRMRLLTLLEEGTASPTELASVTGASLPRVSYHVRRLAAAGLIELVRTQQRRGAVEHYYAAVTPPEISEEAWAPLPKIVKHAVATAHLDHIRDEINAAVAHDGFARDDVHISRYALVLDEEGWRQLAQRMEALIDEIRDIAIQSEGRLGKNGRDGAIEAMSINMLFERCTDAASADGVSVMSKAAGAKPKAPSRKRAKQR